MHSADQRRCSKSRFRGGFSQLEIATVIAVLGLLVALLLPAIQSSRESARRISCTSHIRQLALATEHFVEVHRNYPTLKTFPSGYRGTPSNASIHVQLLPYLDQRALFEKLDPDGWTDAEPPRSMTNEFALNQPIPVFKCPSDSVPAGGNSYRACYGTTPGIHATWKPGRPRVRPLNSEALWGVFLGRHRPAHLRDGASQTALFSERVVGDGDPEYHDPVRDVLRTPDDNYYPNDAVIHCAAVTSREPHLSYPGWTWLSSSSAHTAYNHCLPPNAFIPDCADGWSSAVVHEGAMSARSWHPGGVNVAFADGAVAFIGETIALETWRALATVHGEEIVDGF